ncbi:Putative transposase, RpnA/YhgA-like [Desulfonema limicola]|uniref:Transposase, RpnA/YhgA-like n=1 Tax=Desulfonema limicola TaxID=45656 RepID=A0A975B9W0_9BACT|nr:Rpn family recombination-promoting nuclease/putative transposase [Desulfonema limicola]QTA81616.1 Putative transposase, RpnA/YhgA-like [Desulfonema limicola]
MNKLTDPHDKFIRETFSRKDVAAGFLDGNLPEEIRKNVNLATLSIVKDSFIDKELKEHFSDILYTVKYRKTDMFIYLLFEHKSYPDQLSGFQILRYETKIWEQYLKQNPKAKKLPPIFPMLLYHGKAEWKIPVNFQAIIQNPGLPERYIPEYSYELYDISHIPEEKIRGKVLTRMVLLTAKYIFDPNLRQKLPEILALFNQITNRKTALEMLEIILRYVVRATNRFDEKDVIEIIKETEIGEDIMETFIDKYINQGLSQGLSQGEKRSLTRLLKARFGKLPEWVQDKINLADLKHIEEWSIRLLTADKLNDVLKD